MLKEFIRKVVCPSCKGALVQQDSSLICDKCAVVYTIQNDFINMLYDTNVGQKEIEKREYTLIAQSLDKAGISRFSTFLNYGYVPNANKQYSTIDPGHFCLNLNSVKLLLEVVGDTIIHNRDVIDVGCGRGGNLSAVSKYFMPKSIAGLDICTANIEFCSSKKNSDEMFFLVGDAENIPFANESFDVVLNIESAHAYPNRRQFYEEVYRILRPNGVFLYSELMPVGIVEQNTLVLTEIGFVLSRNQNATSNVLLSCDENAQQRTGAQGIAKKDTGIEEFRDFMALPGSNKYNEMINGTLEYRIMSLIKVG